MSEIAFCPSRYSTSLLFYAIYCSYYSRIQEGREAMSSLSILHRACLRVALLPLRAPLRPSRLPRSLRLPPRSAMSSAASRMSHIAAAASGAAGESNDPAAAASGLAQEDDGWCCCPFSENSLLLHVLGLGDVVGLVDWTGLAGER